MQLTKQESLNLLDALTEWNDIIEPKELADNEIGLNADRYQKLIKKIEQQLKEKIK
jgi:lysophospholipase L1-like esterase